MITGGGAISVLGGQATFGFNAQFTENSTRGEMDYSDDAIGMQFHATITTGSVNGNTGTFSGTCGDNCTLTVTVVDNGEPGDSDTFSIISGDYRAEGKLIQGNIQIHQL